VESFSLSESVKTIFPFENISIVPPNADFGRLEPFAIALILPCSLEKKVTIWEVSEKSVARMQIAVSLLNII
jgi:hypothetical protein